MEPDCVAQKIIRVETHGLGHRREHSSDALAEPIEAGNPVARLDNVHSPALLLIPGGLPIVDSTGALIGAIGVSGGTPEQDAAIANAPLDT